MRNSWTKFLYAGPVYVNTSYFSIQTCVRLWKYEIMTVKPHYNKHKLWFKLIWVFILLFKAKYIMIYLRKKVEISNIVLIYATVYNACVLEGRLIGELISPAIDTSTLCSITFAHLWNFLSDKQRLAVRLTEVILNRTGEIIAEVSNSRRSLC